MGQDGREFSGIALDDDVDSDGGQVKISVIVGNPPYQDDRGTMSTHKSSLYDKFMMLSYGASDCTVMIHPAKLLVKANNDFASSLLNNPHYDYVKYYSDDSIPKVFDSVQIRGGLVIDVMDNATIHEPLNVFIPNSYMMGAYHKVWCSSNDTIAGLDSIIHYGKNTEYLDISMIHHDYPEYSRTYNESTIETDAFRIMPRVFVVDGPSDDYAMVYGLLRMKHCRRWVHRKYLKLADDENFSSYKVIVPQTGDGTIYHAQAKRLIGMPIICDRDTAHTRTFISIGRFQTMSEADHCCKYIKTKFARAMLGLLKLTPLTNPDKFRLIPMQDFTADSDIDWSKSIPEIDQQLYRKYGLDEDEIQFIETHVLPMP